MPSGSDLNAGEGGDLNAAVGSAGFPAGTAAHTDY